MHRSLSQRRPPPRQRGYDVRYERMRRELLQAQPRCRFCGAPATEVHHIVPLARGGTNEPWNLAPVCRECHRLLHRGG
ncbi:MAG: HNH endonuclease [Thermorudis peleae]|nr:HNH endonuclease [Thermorudis peleae]